MNKLLKDFLKHHTIDDIQKSVRGELKEYCTDNVTYYFGNGELIVSPADESLEQTVYIIDTYGDKKYLVEY